MQVIENSGIRKWKEILNLTLTLTLTLKTDLKWPTTGQKIDTNCQIMVIKYKRMVVKNGHKILLKITHGLKMVKVIIKMVKMVIKMVNQTSNK